MLQKTKTTQTVSTSTRNHAIDDLLTKEWLLTNERGSYASSTIVGCNTRGYHGLLVGAINPPVNRIMALANCLEMVILEQKIFNLSTFEFPDKFAPAGFGFLTQFHQDTGVHFGYELNKLKLTKSLYLVRDADTVAIAYSFTRVDGPAEFVMRPFVGMRDFHSLQRSYTPLCSAWFGDGLLVRHDIPGSCGLFLSCPGATFEKDPQWWFNFIYRCDRERGQNFSEDLWTPGFFKCRIEEPTEVVFWASLSPCVMRDASCEKRPQYAIRNTQYELDAVKDDLHRHHNEVITAARPKDEKSKVLCLAADQFIARRSSIVARGTEHERRVTVLAGFPWFADWGRDAFVALPGLLLATSRFEEAKSVLCTFAQAADQGMIPNRFDDYSDTAFFNSVDASLWFINAAFAYLDVSGDSQTFTQQLLPTIRWIVQSYHNGTRFGIHADADGLMTAGSQETQLTWMDAKYDGVAFTPRYGKAVEVNALWYNGLCELAHFYASRNSEHAHNYQTMAEKVGGSFCSLFWNEAAGYLNDCVLPDGTADASLRPNQIFAVSLRFAPPLSPQQQTSIVDTVHKELLTPYGLRTLNVAHPEYKGKYTGPQKDRDQAYHQGTVWPWLIGPFVEAYLKVNGFSRASKKKAAEFIQPLLSHLTEQACLGSVSEIFDGDSPHLPKGCVAQAWSVGELIRAYQLINS